MNLLAISGSLRTASINSALLRFMQRIAAPHMHIHIAEGIGLLPLFNPDLEADYPHNVAQLREQICAADGVIIASPEYAHGVTGAIKNMLDWMVSSDAFVFKPVAVINTSPRAFHADAALRETLQVMNAYIIEPASQKIAVLGVHQDENSMADDQALILQLHTILGHLQNKSV